MPKTIGGDVLGKRYPLNMRTTKQVRDQLEAAALAAGRSLAQEVEYRLQRSFEREAWGAEAFGGPENAALAQLIGAALKTIERHFGKRWNEDAAANEASRRVVLGLMRALKTPMSGLQALGTSVQATGVASAILAALNLPPVGLNDPEIEKPLPSPTPEQAGVAQALLRSREVREENQAGVPEAGNKLK